jgi:hypothetical protein
VTIAVPAASPAVAAGSLRRLSFRLAMTFQEYRKKWEAVPEGTTPGE